METATQESITIAKERIAELKQAIRVYNEIFASHPRELLESIDQYFTMRFFRNSADVRWFSPDKDLGDKEDYVVYLKEIQRLEDELQHLQAKFHEAKFRQRGL